MMEFDRGDVPNAESFTTCVIRPERAAAIAVLQLGRVLIIAGE